MIWDVRVVFLLNGPAVMRLGPEAARFYSGYRDPSSNPSDRSSFHRLSARHVLDGHMLPGPQHPALAPQDVAGQQSFAGLISDEETEGQGGPTACHEEPPGFCGLRARILITTSPSSLRDPV